MDAARVMNRAERRARARVRHRLVQWPARKPLPLPIDLSEGHKAWTCSCASGWLSIASERPLEAHDEHVKRERGELDG